MSESPVPIFTARDGVEAHFVRGLLQQQGIPATVIGDTPIVSFRPLTRSGLPQVVVAPEHQDAAWQIVEQYRRGEHRALPLAEPPWKCPGCGEMIEPQFTDCWNCRTPRPGGDEPTDEAVLPPTDEITLDVPCANCEYNLRGLAPGARCPECGALVTPSLLGYCDIAEPLEAHAIEQLLHKSIEPLVTNPAARPAAVLLLLSLGHALRTTPAVCPDDPMHPGDAFIWRQLSAHALCRNALNYVATELGSFEEMRAQLKQLNIFSARELGQFFFALIAFGLLPPTNFESGEDFSTTPIEQLFVE